MNDVNILAPATTMLENSRVLPIPSSQAVISVSSDVRDNGFDQFHLLLDSVSEYAIFMVSPDGIVMTWNTGAHRIKGYTAEEAIGQHISIFYTEEDRANGVPEDNLFLAKQRGVVKFEGARLRKDGSRFFAEITLHAVRDTAGVLCGFTKITRDITEQQVANEVLEKTRKALFQAQKMEAVGQLTAGIAHDFNNLLTVIMTNLDMIGDPRTAMDRRNRLIESCRHAAERAANLTQQLLAFGRRQPLTPQVHDLNALIEGFETVLRRACGERVSLTLNFVPRPALASVDASQFDSAILNIILNAREAMPNGGSVILETQIVSAEQCHETLPAKPDTDRYVLIRVIDTGKGMSEQTRDRAFEPFFTTKGPSTLAAGLGLSQVWGFVSQSGGYVGLQSQVGVGTSVDLYFPYRGGPDDAAKPTMLLVESDDLLRETTQDMADNLGFNTLIADQPKAIDVLKRTHVDVMFVDADVEGMAFTSEALSLQPDLKVLLVSNELIEGTRLGIQTINKPFNWAQIERSLRRLRSPPQSR